jgi:hypothetical protein
MLARLRRQQCPARKHDGAWAGGGLLALGASGLEAAIASRRLPKVRNNPRPGREAARRGFSGSIIFRHAASRSGYGRRRKNLAFGGDKGGSCAVAAAGPGAGCPSRMRPRLAPGPDACRTEIGRPHARAWEDRAAGRDSAGVRVVTRMWE